MYCLRSPGSRFWAGDIRAGGDGGGLSGTFVGREESRIGQREELNCSAACGDPIGVGGPVESCFCLRQEAWVFVPLASFSIRE